MGQEHTLMRSNRTLQMRAFRRSSNPERENTRLVLLKNVLSAFNEWRTAWSLHACRPAPLEQDTLAILTTPKVTVSRLIQAGGAVQLLRDSGTNPSVYYVPSKTAPNVSLAPIQVVKADTVKTVKDALKPIIVVAAAVVGGAALINMTKKDDEEERKAK